MDELIRRLKATLGMGLTWAAGWAVIGAVVAVAMGVIGWDPPGFFRTLVGVFSGVGFLAGAAFAGLLQLTERQKRFSDLSLPKFALWGGIGGLVLGGLASIALLGGAGFQVADLFVTATTTVLGAGSAVGTLVVARGANDRTDSLESTDMDAVESKMKNLLGGSKG